jgi:serine/threonine protein kinase
MIGSYQRVRSLGTGSLGITWLVKDKTGKEYAAKVIPIKTVDEAKIKKEIDVIKKMKSQYLVEFITDFKNPADKSFILIFKNYTSNLLNNLNRWKFK